MNIRIQEITTITHAEADLRMANDKSLSMMHTAGFEFLVRHDPKSLRFTPTDTEIELEIVAQVDED